MRRKPSFKSRLEVLEIAAAKPAPSPWDYSLLTEDELLDLEILTEKFQNAVAAGRDGYDELSSDELRELLRLHEKMEEKAIQ